MGKLWYYGKKTYGTIGITMVLYRKLLKFDLPREKHGRLPKTKKLFIMEKKMIKYQNNEDFTQIHSFRTLIYFVCLFICLEFIVPLNNCSLIWKRHHCLLIMKCFDIQC